MWTKTLVYGVPPEGDEIPEEEGDEIPEEGEVPEEEGSEGGEPSPAEAPDTTLAYSYGAEKEWFIEGDANNWWPTSGRAAASAKATLTAFSTSSDERANVITVGQWSGDHVEGGTFSINLSIDWKKAPNAAPNIGASYQFSGDRFVSGPMTETHFFAGVIQSVGQNSVGLTALLQSESHALGQNNNVVAKAGTKLTVFGLSLSEAQY
jgi:hypothetical protein